MALTVAGVARAIRKNGWAQAFGSFHDTKDGKVSACALGQAAKNLGYDFEDGSSLSEALDAYKDSDGEGLGSSIMRWNDELKLPLDRIARRVERSWAHVLDEPVQLNTDW